MPQCWFNGENSIWNSLPTTPKSIDGYSKFATKILEWYRDDIQIVEFLNEPNKPGSNYPVAEYTNLVMRSAVRLVKSGYEGDRDAFSFYNFREKEWGYENYESGIYPYITAASDHAYGFGAGPQCADKDVCEATLVEQYTNILDFGGWKDIDWTETGAPNTCRALVLQSIIRLLKILKINL